MVELRVIESNFEIILPMDGIREKLATSKKENRKLNIKFGFDPTAPDLHLGHAVGLKKIKQFQDLGHNLVLIIGDFTACIGDPTGRNKTRPPLSREQVEENAQTYLEQFSKIVDLSKAEIRRNSEWFDKMSFREIVSLLSKVTLSHILQREDFDNRIKNHHPIYFNELLYPIMQGYDSLMVNADIEIGGTDQLFNCAVGRYIQNAFGKESQAVCCVPILRGTDGSMKMSKTYKNYIGLTENPRDMFGKVMSIPDDLILEYCMLISNFDIEKLECILDDSRDGFSSINPMELKKELAANIVEQLYDADTANECSEFFYKQVQSRDPSLTEFVPVSVSTVSIDNCGEVSLIDLCHAMKPEESRSQIKRFIDGGGVQINFETKKDFQEKIKLSSGLKIKIGKRSFFELTD